MFKQVLKLLQGRLLGSTVEAARVLESLELDYRHLRISV